MYKPVLPGKGYHLPKPAYFLLSIFHFLIKKNFLNLFARIIYPHTFASPFEKWDFDVCLSELE
jgi:hypothetical protein